MKKPGQNRNGVRGDLAAFTTARLRAEGNTERSRADNQEVLERLSWLILRYTEEVHGPSIVKTKRPAERRVKNGAITN